MPSSHRQVISDLLRRLDEAEKRIPVALDAVGRAWADAARQECPVGTSYDAQGQPIPGGQLRDSIHWERTGPTEGALVMLGRAAYVIDGTAPHTILPVRGRVLRFIPAGGPPAVFAARVQHPGTQPNDFVRRAWQSGAVQAAIARFPELLFQIG